MAKKKTDNPEPDTTDTPTPDEPDTTPNTDEQALPGTEPEPTEPGNGGDDTPPEPGSVTF